MISYAQNAEDVVLMRALGDVAGGFYVDIGAWDPLVESVTRAFYEAGWTGLNVEPQPERAALFSRLRPKDTNVCAAASDTAGVSTLFITRHSSLATVEASIIDSSNPKYTIVTTMQTPTVPIADLLDAHGGDRPIHFMKIDVEGHEAAVLRGANFARHRPFVLLIEATCPTTGAPKWSAWEHIVLAAGYTFTLFDGINRFYVCNERPDLVPKLSWGANCLDGYITTREAEMLTRIASLERQLSAAKQELAAMRASLAADSAPPSPESSLP